MANMLLIPLLGAGITHLVPQRHPMLLALGVMILTSAAWLIRPPIGAALQIVVGAVIAAVILVPRDGHLVLPRNPYELALALLLLAPLVAAVVAAIAGIRRRRERQQRV
jgi:peptidoglycan/LPS O-acetylase OafA/YrhL